MYINLKDLNGGKYGWECQWCGLSFKPRHATRALRHVLKLKGGDIAICRAVITVRYREQYQAFYNRQFIRIETKRKSDEMTTYSVTEQQEAAVQSLLLDKRRKPRYGASVIPLTVFLLPMLPLAVGAARICRKKVCLLWNSLDRHPSVK